jgi:hypothetical protein
MLMGLTITNILNMMKRMTKKEKRKRITKRMRMKAQSKSTLHM